MQLSKLALFAAFSENVTSLFFFLRNSNSVAFLSRLVYHGLDNEITSADNATMSLDGDNNDHKSREHCAR